MESVQNLHSRSRGVVARGKIEIRNMAIRFPTQLTHTEIDKKRSLFVSEILGYYLFSLKPIVILSFNFYLAK